MSRAGALGVGAGGIADMETPVGVEVQLGPIRAEERAEAEREDERREQTEGQWTKG